MSDPTEQLSTVDAGSPVNPMPASDVRRRGERLRRRNNILAGVGAAAAVVAIATPVALAGADRERSAPPATPSPSAEWLQQIPDDLDLTVDMPENDSGEPVLQSEADEGVGTVDFCGTRALPPTGPVDRVAASASGPEYGESRELRLYPDDEAAAAAATEFREAVVSCPTEDYSETTWIHDVKPSAFGVDALVVTQTFEVGGESLIGGSFWQIVRVGNALLVTANDAEFGPDLAEPIALHTDRIGPVVESMCVFADEGCARPEEQPTPTETPSASQSEEPRTGDIPADFPLDAGWPEDFEPGRNNGPTGPDPSIGLDVPLCGEVPYTAEPDRLGATWTNPEDLRTRVLLSFDDAEQAVAYVGKVRALAERCGPEDIGDGLSRQLESRDTRVGGQSFAAVRTIELTGGGPIPGLEVLHVIRLGRAVLLDYTANEGAGGPDPESEIRAQIEDQTAASAVVVAAMCAFTEDGC